MTVLWESFKIALQSLRQNLMRSLLTTLGIVIGISTVIAIVSIVEGLNEAFSNELASIGQGVLYVQKFPWADQNWQKSRHWPNITMKEYHAIEREARYVSGLTPMTGNLYNVKWRSRKLELIQVLGVNEQYAGIRNAYPAVGRNFTKLDSDRARHVCLIGHDVAEKLFGNHNPLGEYIRVGTEAFQVIGVIAKKGEFFDQNLDTFVLVPYNAFIQSMEGHHGLSIAVRVISAEMIPAAKEDLRGILRRVRKVPVNKGDNFSINQVDVLKQLYDKLTGGLYAAMFAVAFISLLVGGIGIMNIMLVSVTERTREIGVRKALGAKPRWILLQFLLEAVILACIGGAIGIQVGAGLAKLVAALTPLAAVVKSWAVMLGLGFSSLVGIFFGIFPARTAARKDPIEALHYE